MFEDDIDTTFIHDEDSDWPNEVMDEERELTDDEERICDIIYGTIGDLEDAVEDRREKILIGRDVAAKALQLLKAYSNMYNLTLDEYETEY